MYSDLASNALALSSMWRYSHIHICYIHVYTYVFRHCPHISILFVTHSFYRAGALFNVALLKDASGEEEEAYLLYEKAMAVG